MPHVKIALLGAGSHYFSGVLGQLAITEGLSGSEITLYDLDWEKSELMARLGNRFAEQAGTATWRKRAVGSLIPFPETQGH